MVQKNNPFDCFPLHFAVFMATAQEMLLEGGRFCVRDGFRKPRYEEQIIKRCSMRCEGGGGKY